jgi:hypothetical protein
MGTWFWWNIPLALVFFGCWAGIPLFLTLTRWKHEIEARHAEIAATAALEPVAAQPAQAAAIAPRAIGGAVYTGVAGSAGS